LNPEPLTLAAERPPGFLAGKCREVAVNLAIEESTWLVVTVSDEGAAFDPIDKWINLHYSCI